MYGSLFGNSNRNSAPPSTGTTTTTSSNIHYVEASASSGGGTSGTSTSTKTFNTQISLPPLMNQQQQQSTRSTGSSGDNVSLLYPVEDSNGGGQAATLTSCIINLANTIIGAGMLGLPGALGGTGYLGGTLLMILGAFFSAHGLQLLSKAAQQAGLPSSFYTVARAAVPHYTILIDLAVALKCFGVATGYLITVGDCMVDALDHILMTRATLQEESAWIQIILSRQFWVVGATLAVLPVSFYRTLDELKKASALALVFVVALVFGIVAYANHWADPCEDYDDGLEGSCRGEIETFTSAPRTLSKLPIFVFAFTCHQNIFPIVNEIQNRTQTRLDTVIALSIGISFGVFCLVALEGYRTFGRNVRGDILLNYPETTKVTILRICIAFMLTLHYPLQLDPSRRCITSLLQVLQRKFAAMMVTTNSTRTFHRRDSDLEQEATEHSTFNTCNKSGTLPAKHHNNNLINHNNHNLNNESFTNPSPIMFYGITIGFLLASFGVAMMVHDLGVILALVGATGSTLVSYILPGLIYVKIHEHSIMDWSKIGAYIQLGLGCCIMPVALYFVLMGSARE